MTRVDVRGVEPRAESASPAGTGPGSLVELTPPAPDSMESVHCYACGSSDREAFLEAEDDLTGKPGRWTFVRCADCGLAYQHPRVPLDTIGAYYDDEYIAHRKTQDWGILTPLYEWAMSKHDRDKDKLCRRYLKPTPSSHILDVGCAAGTFLLRMGERYGSKLHGVDFKDLSDRPGFEGIDFRCGLLLDQGFEAGSMDLVTMWHYLEHDYDPQAALVHARELLKEDGLLIIEVPRLDSRTFAWYGDRWPGLQAPQHTVLFDSESLPALVERAGLEVVDHLAWGSFPAYFYIYAGRAFRKLEGRGLDLRKIIAPYFLGQLLLSPYLLFEKHLNLAMQTVVCRRAK